nr:hypothetical protein [Streptomyces sp. HG99]
MWWRWATPPCCWSPTPPSTRPDGLVQTGDPDAHLRATGPVDEGEARAGLEPETAGGRVGQGDIEDRAARAAGQPPGGDPYLGVVEGGEVGEVRVAGSPGGRPQRAGECVRARAHQGAQRHREPVEGLLRSLAYGGVGGLALLRGDAGADDQRGVDGVAGFLERVPQGGVADRAGVRGEGREHRRRQQDGEQRGDEQQGCARARKKTNPVTRLPPLSRISDFRAMLSEGRGGGKRL